MSDRREFLAAVSALAGVVGFAARAETAVSGPSAAKRELTFDDYYGTKVSDPYRWMEDGKNPDRCHGLKHRTLTPVTF